MEANFTKITDNNWWKRIGSRKIWRNKIKLRCLQLSSFFNEQKNIK